MLALVEDLPYFFTREIIGGKTYGVLVYIYNKTLAEYTTTIHKIDLNTQHLKRKVISKVIN